MGKGNWRLTEVSQKDGDQLGNFRNELWEEENHFSAHWGTDKVCQRLFQTWRNVQPLWPEARGSGSVFKLECNSEPLYFLSPGTCWCHEKMVWTRLSQDSNQFPVAIFTTLFLSVHAFEWLTEAEEKHLPMCKKSLASLASLSSQQLTYSDGYTLGTDLSGSYFWFMSRVKMAMLYVSQSNK